jgi:aminoglycoside phosphotransferase (APT) family kinase protein
MDAFDEISICRKAVANIGGEVAYVGPLSGGEVNSVFAVDLSSGKRVVVRLHRRTDKYSPTVETLHALKGIGLPVPHVLGNGTNGEFSFIILSWTPGVELRWALSSLTARQKTTIAEQIVGFQRRAMTLPRGVAFGWTGIGQRAQFPTWRMIVGEHGDLTGAPNELLDYLDAVRTVCFLDDITGKNVLIHDGMLAGLIDFDGVCYGDPLHWLALTIVGLVCDVGHDFYADELIRLWGGSELEARALGLYAALICDEFVTRHAQTSPRGWLERMQLARATWWQQAILAK